VVHIGPYFLEFFNITVRTLKPRQIAIGGMVPYVRFSRGAKTRLAIELLAKARKSFDGLLHVFGFGGGVTSLHIAAALNIDSTDSSGWRVRAARGLILVPGRGERIMKHLNGPKGRAPSREDFAALENCECPPCRTVGMHALAMLGRPGFEHRATHNLWVLSRESALLNGHRGRDLRTWSLARLNNSQRRFLPEHAFKLAGEPRVR
jgi:7-cyano-7-deazaguanine tRNA-ribosyltransferase